MARITENAFEDAHGGTEPMRVRSSLRRGRVDPTRDRDSSRAAIARARRDKAGTREVFTDWDCRMTAGGRA